ncbi:prominin family protein [Pontibacter cellulosilyticus]|nr:prominin family protein [Pontibacter cellulosilyticus]
MMKRFFVAALLCLGVLGAQAQNQEQKKVQEDKLTRLMEEREQLVMEYQFYNQQNSNFWGKKSKSDLLSIIETLKKIINKDTQLIAAVKEASLKKIAESTVELQREGKIVREDQRIIDARFSNLQSQVKTLQSQIKKRERTIKELEDQVTASSDLRYGKDKVISIMAVVCFILLLYAVFLQVRLNKAKAAAVKPRARKKV